MKFKPGDRVRLAMDRELSRGFGAERGTAATVGPGGIQHRKWFCGDMVDLIWDAGSNQGDGEYGIADFDLIDQRLDPKRPIVTRAGFPVELLPSQGGDRPFQAVVTAYGQPFVLTYQPSGRFYKHYDCPIDLINKDADDEIPF